MVFQKNRLFVLSVLAVLTTIVVSAQTRNRTQQPARDTPAQPTTSDAPAPKGRLTGRVVAADTARPVKRARVLINAAELPGGRGVLTDDEGVFDFTELPAGRYTLTVSKSGFITLSYGQRRPLQAGTPLQLAADQQLTGIDFKLPRGGAIAGHVFDESGDPLPGANVQVLRYQYAQGNRQLMPAGVAQTDDQGYYRVWGLNPGDYYISAVTRNFDMGGRGIPVGPGGPGGPGGGRGAVFFGGPMGDAVAQALQSRGVPPPGGPQVEAEPVAYAPTFYPGVPSAEEARPVALGLSAELLDINFGLLLVRTSRIGGHVTNPDGTPVTAGTVNLMPESTQSGRGGFARMLGSRVQWDGAFSIANVPPGRYVLRARGDDSTAPQFAVQPLTVTEGDMGNLTVVLAPGASISGTVTFQATQTPTLPDLNQIRVSAPSVDVANIGGNQAARVDRDGKFTLDSVPAGLHWIRPQGPMRGWTLKSVVVGGRETIDTPLELRSGQKIAGVTLVFTDKLSEVNGTVTDDRGTPIVDYTVLAFPTDSSLWRPQARQIMTARPDQNGKYQMRGLPPGDYYLATVDPAEQGEWFEPAFLDQHRNGATRISVGDGDVKTQDFHLSLR